jgi:hypothetical protein
MLRWLMRKRLEAFEKAYDYDMGYARQLLDADPRALMAFGKVMAMSTYRKEVPPSPWYAAKLVGTVAEDCGPCTQLVATMAEREGVPPETVRSVLEGDLGAMPDDVALAYQFAQSSLAHDPEAGVLRDRVVARWGPKGLVSLAFAVTSARIFPTLKYALGHGHACVRVTVAGRPTTVNAVGRHPA